MRFARFGLGLVALSVASLALASVSVDFNKAADFSKYKTYQWKQGTPTPNPLMQERLKAAIEKELKAKGVTPATDKADLIVITHARLETQRSVDVTTFGYGGYYGWHGGMATSTLPGLGRVGEVMSAGFVTGVFACRKRSTSVSLGTWLSALQQLSHWAMWRSIRACSGGLSRPRAKALSCSGPG